MRLDCQFPFRCPWFSPAKVERLHAGLLGLMIHPIETDKRLSLWFHRTVPDDHNEGLECRQFRFGSRGLEQCGHVLPLLTLLLAPWFD